MRVHLLLFLLLSAAVFAQVGGDRRKNQLRINQFALSHLDAIKKYTAVDAFEVQLAFNDDLVLDNVLYRTIVINGSGKHKVDTTTRLVIFPELDSLIRKSFAFVPNTNFERDYGKTTSISFGIALNERDLKSAIAELEKEKLAIAKRFTEDRAEGIATNAAFTIEAKLIAKRQSFPKIKFEGALSGYNSTAIAIAPDYYLVFNVISTSVGSMFRQKVQYTVYHVYGKSSEMLFKGTEDITGGKATLYPPGDENDIITIEGNEDVNFEMTAMLQFESVK